MKTPPEIFGSSKVLMCYEGNPMAALVTNKAGNRTLSTKRVETPEAALAWSRKNRVTMVYLPSNHRGN